MRTDPLLMDLEGATLKILVFNCGSSSLTYKVFEAAGDEDIIEVFSGKFHRVGVTGSEPSYSEFHYRGRSRKEKLPVKNHREASSFALTHLRTHGIEPDYIGHRFVHGGSLFHKSGFINGDVLEKLRRCLPLAPIHNPIALSVIDECGKTLPRVMQYVTFDSAFHSSIPYHAYTYALPMKITERFGFRKYGFHGLSYLNAAKEASRFLELPPERQRIVACHLGTGGSSVAAIEGGHSRDTSMGYSPLTGLMMSTRCGDIDPMLSLYIMAAFGYRSSEVEELLNKMSGILGVSGLSGDIRDVARKMSEDDGKHAHLAFNMYIHRLKKYIGSYIIILKGIDILAFTDDIGVQNCFVREKVCEDMEWCGLRLDQALNRDAHPDKVCSISAKGSKVRILTIPAQEERTICAEGMDLLRVKK